MINDGQLRINDGKTALIENVIPAYKWIAS